MKPGPAGTPEAVHASPWRLAPLLIVAAAFLGACGGSSSDPGDTTPPTVAITDSVAAATATGDVTFTFTFSEDIGSSFIAADVTVTGGTKGLFTKVSGTVTTLVVVPTAATQGTIDVSVAAGSFTDLAGNASTGGASASQAYDTQVALTQMALPVTFDAATVDYGLIGFGGADDSTVVVDPTDAANKVARVVKTSAAQTWAGTTVTAAAELGFSSPLPFTASDTRMTVRVWSPDAGIKVRLKAEDHAIVTDTVETDAVTTVAGAWEVLTFDFATPTVPPTAALDLAKRYDKVSIFFNFGVDGATAGEKTYYFDDLVFIGGGGLGGGATTPATLPPVPAKAPGADVYALLSSVTGGYAGTVSDQGSKVDTWLTVWSAGSGGTTFDITAAGGTAHPRQYTFRPDAVFVGIEFIGNPVGTNEIDAAGLGLDTLHVDLWTPDNATNFQLKLVDAGADGIVGAGGDDSEGIATLTTASTPPLATGSWISYDLPLASAFPGLLATGHLAQLVLVAPNGGTMYLDNLYLYDGGAAPPPAPTTAPARPTAAAATVISLLSNAYTNHAVDTWRTSWSAAVLTEVVVGGDDMKKYSGLDFVGVETTGANLVDASGMAFLHLDVWTADATTFRVKLVDVGADAAFGGGNDTEHELAFTSATTPALASGAWTSLDLPLSSFTNLASRAHLAQYIFSALPTGASTVWVANVYFHQ